MAHWSSSNIRRERMIILDDKDFKFRARNVHDDKLYYSEEIGMPNFWQQVRGGHMVDVEQYIGQNLHGQDIYGGDIIYRPEILNKSGRGGWSEVKYIIEYGEQCDPDGWRYMGYNYTIPDGDILEYTKIIGNKTDNPELAEGIDG